MNILLIRLRLIGDVVFTTPILRALRRQYPGARLAYLVEPHAAPIVAGNPHLDEVIVAARPDAPGRLAADLPLARRLRAARYDLVLDLHGGPRSALLAWASGAPRRIGYTVTGRGWMYTERVRAGSVAAAAALGREPVGPPDAAGLRCAGPGTRRDRDGWPRPRPSRRSPRKLAAAGVDPAGDQIIVVHVSAGNPFRRWPAASFVALLTRADAGGSATAGSSSSPDRRSTRRRGRSVSRREPRWAADGGGVVDRGRVRPRGTAGADGRRGPVHRRRQRSAARGRDDRRAGGRPLRPDAGGALGAVAAVALPSPSRSNSRTLPCRPCDQRRCEPGDFRCLGSIPPAHGWPTPPSDALNRRLDRTYGDCTNRPTRVAPGSTALMLAGLLVVVAGGDPVLDRHRRDRAVADARRLGRLARAQARAPRRAALVLAACWLTWASPSSPRRSRSTGCQSLGASKQMLLYLVVPATYAIARGRRARHGRAGDHHRRGHQRHHRRRSSTAS